MPHGAEKTSHPPMGVELHLHLEGALTAARAQSLHQIATGVPAFPEGGIVSGDSGVEWAFEDLGGFLRLFGWATQLLRGPREYGLLLRDLLASLRAQEIQYAEIFVAIGQMHRADIDPAKVLPELSRIARESHDAGGPRIGFIADATRQWGVAACDRVLDTALQLQEFDIVGFGVGGDERALRARELKAVYRRAAAAELGLSCHAGEGSSADAVREVVEELGVRRVGHGIAAAADSRLMRELAEEDVLLEICPTSNRLTGAWREGDHPMLRLHAAGVPLCLGSDDPAFFGCTLESECALVREWGLGDQDMDAFRQNAWRHTFSQS